MLPSLLSFVHVSEETELSGACFSHSSQWGAFPTALGAISILECGAEVMLSCDQGHTAKARCQLLLNTKRKEEYDRNRTPS